MVYTAGAVLFLVLIPALVSASVWDWFANRASAETEQSSSNTRTIALLSGSRNPNPQLARGGGDISIIGGNALASETSPLAGDGTFTEGGSGAISLYVVREGDTLSEIADMFDVTANTIRWANDIGAKGTISPGDKLVILPITGVKYTVKKGDTLASIAKKYKGDTEEILQFNGLSSASELATGVEIIIPNGEVVPAAAPKKSTAPASKSYSSSPTYAGYYMRPISGGYRSQGIHGYNGVDLAAPLGTTVYASAAGEVIISRDSGWNGGYGNYIVVRHDNGTQTLYSHLGSNSVSVGQSVAQGSAIGTVGLTGKTTGAHVHFEIRGAKNPF